MEMENLLFFMGWDFTLYCLHRLKPKKSSANGDSFPAKLSV